MLFKNILITLGYLLLLPSYYFLLVVVFLYSSFREKGSMRKCCSLTWKLFHNMVRTYLFIFNTLVYIVCSSSLNLLLYPLTQVLLHALLFFFFHYGNLSNYSFFLSYFIYSLFLHLAIITIINFKLHI